MQQKLSTDDITIKGALTGDELREDYKRPSEMPFINSKR